MILHKACTKCGKDKPRGEFYSHKTRNDGLSCWCRACDSAAHKARYAADPEKKRAAAQRWHLANVERNRANAKAWIAANPDRAKANVKAWRARNRDRMNERAAARRAGDPQRFKSIQNRYRQNHPERDKASRRASCAKRRALIAGVAAEKFDPIEILERDGWHCHICGIATPQRLRGSYDPLAPELDHIIPIAAGGEHSRKNTACACRRCNKKKSARPLGQLRLFG